MGRSILVFRVKKGSDVKGSGDAFALSRHAGDRHPCCPQASAMEGFGQATRAFRLPHLPPRQAEVSN